MPMLMNKVYIVLVTLIFIIVIFVNAGYANEQLPHTTEAPAGYAGLVFGDKFADAKDFFENNGMKVYPIYGVNPNIAFQILGDYIPELDKQVFVDFYFTFQSYKLYKIIVYFDNVIDERVEGDFRNIVSLFQSKYGKPENITESKNTASWRWEEKEIMLQYNIFRKRFIIEYKDLVLNKENNLTAIAIKDLQNKKRKQYLEKKDKL